MMNRIWNEESGVLTFEWILLLTVLVIGIIGGVATIRNSINKQAINAGNAIVKLNTSFNLSATSDDVGGTTSDSSYTSTTDM